MGAKPCDGGPEVRRRVVPELRYEGMALQCGLNDATQHSAAAPVHQAHLEQTDGCGLFYVFGDNRGDVARSEGVEIQLTFYGDANRITRHDTAP